MCVVVYWYQSWTYHMSKFSAMTSFDNPWKSSGSSLTDSGSAHCSCYLALTTNSTLF